MEIDIVDCNNALCKGGMGDSVDVERGVVMHRLFRKLLWFLPPLSLSGRDEVQGHYFPVHTYAVGVM